MFEKASRMKLRLKSGKGSVTAEDLWDFPLQSATQPCLDDLAKDSYQKLQNTVESFVSNKKNQENDTEELRLDILKRIIGVKIQERKVKEDETAKKAQKERILDIIDAKDDKELEGKSKKELRKIYKNL